MFKSFSLGQTVGEMDAEPMEKAKGDSKAGHKYLKRTGSPGNYKYWYKLPNGHIVSSDSAEGAPHVDHEKKLDVDERHGSGQKQEDQGDDDKMISAVKQAKKELGADAKSADIYRRAEEIEKDPNSKYVAPKEQKIKREESNPDAGKKKGSKKDGEKPTVEKYLKDFDANLEAARKNFDDPQDIETDIMNASGIYNDLDSLYEEMQGKDREEREQIREKIDALTEIEGKLLQTVQDKVNGSDDDDIDPMELAQELEESDDFQVSLGDIIAGGLAENLDPYDFDIDPEDDDAYDRLLEAAKDSDEYEDQYQDTLGEIVDNVYNDIMNGKRSGDTYFDEDDHGKPAKKFNKIFRDFIDSKIKERSKENGMKLSVHKDYQKDDKKEVKKSMENDMFKSFRLGPTIHEHDTEVEFGKSLDSSVQNYFDVQAEKIAKSTSLEAFFKQPEDQKVDQLIKSEDPKMVDKTKSDVATMIQLEYRFRDKPDTMF